MFRDRPLDIKSSSGLGYWVNQMLIIPSYIYFQLPCFFFGSEALDSIFTLLKQRIHKNLQNVWSLCDDRSLLCITNKRYSRFWVFTDLGFVVSTVCQLYGKFLLFLLEEIWDCFPVILLSKRITQWVCLGVTQNLLEFCCSNSPKMVPTCLFCEYFSLTKN